MAVEQRRGCGYRKIGGLYLVGTGSGEACDRLPIPLTVCPTCHAGIKQSRGWTWVNVPALVGGDHTGCKDEFPCPLCMAPDLIGNAGLLWIGERFYPTPAHFEVEANSMGISRRISAIPKGFHVGETWVLFAHRRAASMACPQCRVTVDEGCRKCNGRVSYMGPGIFRVFKPSAIEKIVTQSQACDADEMEKLRSKGITPVAVPDDDPDHQGTVYDEEDCAPAVD